MSHYFNAFLHGLGLKKLLVQFEGNRFNVVFLNDGILYYHRRHMITILQTLAEKNQLANAVEEDLDMIVYLAGTRAQGIIGKLITGPLINTFMVELRIFYHLLLFLIQ